MQKTYFWLDGRSVYHTRDDCPMLYHREYRKYLRFYHEGSLSEARGKQMNRWQYSAIESVKVYERRACRLCGKG